MKVRINTKKLSKLSFQKPWGIFIRPDGKKTMWNLMGKVRKCFLGGGK